MWFGRAGCQWAFKRDEMLGDLWGIPRWDPIHGDSVQFTFDGVPAILLDSMTVGWYSEHGATWGPDGDLRPTDRGGCRDTLSVRGRPGRGRTVGARPAAGQDLPLRQIRTCRCARSRG